MRNRDRVVASIVGLAAGALCVVMVGCGAVHGTDGQTLTAIGFVRQTDGQTQTELGAGKGMDNNLSAARANTFSNRSPAAIAAFGFGKENK